VKKTKPVVIWNNRAIVYFRNTFDKIKQDSVSNAEKVRDGIAKIVDGLADNPEKYPRDKYKKNNTGNYRAFEKYSLRIAYKYTSKEIRVLRVRHVRQEPKNY
jgi:plasmid stabilization system protein ParE